MTLPSSAAAAVVQQHPPPSMAPPGRNTTDAASTTATTVLLTTVSQQQQQQQQQREREEESSRESVNNETATAAGEEGSRRNDEEELVPHVPATAVDSFGSRTLAQVVQQQDVPGVSACSRKERSPSTQNEPEEGAGTSISDDPKGAGSNVGTSTGHDNTSDIIFRQDNHKQSTTTTTNERAGHRPWQHPQHSSSSSSSLIRHSRSEDPAAATSSSSSSLSFLPQKKSWSSAELFLSSSSNQPPLSTNNNNNNDPAAVHAPLKKRWVPPTPRDVSDNVLTFSSSSSSSGGSSVANTNKTAELLSMASTEESMTTTDEQQELQPSMPSQTKVNMMAAKQEEKTLTSSSTTTTSKRPRQDDQETTMVQDEKDAKKDTQTVVVDQSNSPKQQYHEETVLDKLARELAEARTHAAANDDDDSSSSSEETDDEQVMAWGCRMFGIAAAPAAMNNKKEEEEESPQDASTNNFRWEDYMPPVVSLAERVKMRRGKDPAEMDPTCSKKAVRKRKKAVTVFDPSKLSPQEAKRRKQLAKPLTAAELRTILAEDDDDGRMPCSNDRWVRRSVRLPSRALLTSPNVKNLLEKLRMNDSDMQVLKMKKYVGDLDAPQVVIDAVLDALEENSNCQSLYIQNFNEGMRDEQVLHLMSVLQLPTCKIWCLNIGETYNVSMKTWKIFVEGLKKTKITHMYASEHTITTALKEEIRDTIRQNRKKHNMHIDPNNLDVIVQCTHCWWNPINAKVLRPYLRKRGYEHILYDKEALGLKGSMSEAPGDGRPS